MKIHEAIVEDAMAHHQFTADLIEHVWSLRDVGTD
jgi:hypothetical protein